MLLRKPETNYLQVSIHWGSNWGYQVPEAQRVFAHALIDSGSVDLIHGHSSHHPRPIEVYRDKLILYGCGDFINDYEGIESHEQFRGDLTLMFFPELDLADGRLLNLHLVPMQMHRFRLHYATEQDLKWVNEVLNAESAQFGTRVQVRGHQLVVEREQ